MRKRMVSDQPILQIGCISYAMKMKFQAISSNFKHKFTEVVLSCFQEKYLTNVTLRKLNIRLSRNISQKARFPIHDTI